MASKKITKVEYIYTIKEYSLRTLLKQTKNINDCSVCLNSKECYKYFGCSHNNLCCECFKSISLKTCPLCRSK